MKSPLRQSALSILSCLTFSHLEDIQLATAMSEPTKRTTRSDAPEKRYDVAVEYKKLGVFSSSERGVRSREQQHREWH